MTELMGLTEIGRMLDVSKQRAGQLAQREDFPAPLSRLAQGPVWRRADVEAWARATGRLD